MGLTVPRGLEEAGDVHHHLERAGVVRVAEPQARDQRRAPWPVTVVVPFVASLLE